MFFATGLLLSLLLSALPASTAQASAPAAPVLVSISGCPLSADGSTLLCLPPFALTLVGSGFSLASNSVVNMSGYTCQPLSVSVDGTSMSCLVADSYTPILGAYDTPVPVSVFDLSTHLSSNALTSLQVQSVQPVLLTSISGCEGSGLVTNNCDLNSSVVTIAGSGFTSGDSQRWYLVIAPSTIQTVLTDFNAQEGTAYPLVNGSFVLSLSYALRLWTRLQLSSLTNATTGTMAVCLTHGNTAPSSCLALSYAYAPLNQPLPVAPPTAGIAVNSSLTVTAVTGCRTDFASNGSTLGCSPSSFNQLTILGTNFPSDSYQLYITVGRVRCISPYGGSTAISRVMCAIPAEYQALQFDQWLPVVVMDASSLQQSPPAYLVQFTASPVLPLVSAVSGCSGDGASGALSTSGCDLSSVVTISGSGFVNDGTQWRLSVALAGSTTSVNQLSIFTFTASGTQITVPTSQLYSIIAPSITQLVNVVTLYVRHGTWLVGPVQITIPTTPLSVTRVLGCAAGANANFTVVGCAPGVSTLTIQGVSFLSATTVTVAGLPCAITSYQSTSLVCLLPTPVGLQPGVAYDLFIQNFAGNVSLPGAVRYTFYPTIVAVTSPFCPPDFAFSGTSGSAPLFCSAYAQLTLVGVYFQQLSTLTVNISSASALLPALTCGNLSYQSSTELTCTLPAPGPEYAQYQNYIQIWENATFASNRWATRLYTELLQQPNLVSVSGCASVDAVTRVASGCQAGDVLTLLGSNFAAGSTPVQVQLWSDGEAFLCSSPSIVSRAQMTCVLPFLPLLAVDSVVPVRIANMRQMQSNWLVAVSFAPASTGQSSNDTNFIVSLAVLVPLVAALLLVLALLLHSRRASKLSGGGQHTSTSGGAGWSRHSDEKEVEVSGLQMSGVSVDMYSNEQ